LSAVTLMRKSSRRYQKPGSNSSVDNVPRTIEDQERGSNNSLNTDVKMKFRYLLQKKPSNRTRQWSLRRKPLSIAQRLLSYLLIKRKLNRRLLLGSPSIDPRHSITLKMNLLKRKQKMWVAASHAPSKRRWYTDAKMRLPRIKRQMLIRLLRAKRRLKAMVKRLRRNHREANLKEGLAKMT
jgi:hypothetical protein